MRTWVVRLAVLLLLLAVAVGVLYLAADAWLESAGGRHAVERELARRSGLPVRLEGAFEVMLLPSIGVEGTELLVGGPGADDAFLHSREYAVALALRPLLRGELRVLSVRLAQGALRLDRLPAFGTATAEQPEEPLSLPTIDELSIEGFTVALPGGRSEPLQMDEFRLEDFAAGRDARFRIQARGLGRADGTLRWDPGNSSLNLDATVAGLLPGALSLGGRFDYGASTGAVSAQWPLRPAEPGDVLALSTGFALSAGGARLSGVELSAGGQTVRGAGCLLPDGEAPLQLVLESDLLDFDRLPGLPPIAGASGGNDGVPEGLNVAIRLEAAEVRQGDAVARNAVLTLGADPDCSSLD